MKLGTGLVFLVFALVGNSEGSSLNEKNDGVSHSQHLRTRRIEDATTTGTSETTSSTTDTSGTTSGTTDTSGTTSGTTIGTTSGTTTFTMSSPTATQYPVKQLKYHIGGGSYNDIKVLNNIGYALMGYDLIKGNPLDTSGLVRVDQGFRNPIFETEDYKLQVDREYYAPAGLNVVECEGCNTHATTKVLDSLSDYVSSLNTKVGVGASFDAAVVKGQFSASFDYKQAKEMMTKEHSTSTESEISCCVYQATISAYQMPPYSGNFLEAVARLKKAALDDEQVQRRMVEVDEAPVEEANVAETTGEVDETPVEEANVAEATGEVAASGTTTTTTTLKNEIRKFVHEFGTHYVQKVTMGSLFGEQTYISQEDSREMKEKGIDIRLAASVSVGTLADISANFGLDSDVKETMEFLSKTSRKSTYSRGAKPIGDGDTDAWLKYSSDNPVPTHIEILPIQDLDAYGDPKIVKAIEDYVGNYCAEVDGAECDVSQSEVGMGGEGSLSYTPSHFQGKDQPRFIETKTDPFDNNRNYDTAATWLITGLSGTVVDGSFSYSAIVSDLGTSHMHPTGSVGWTGWSNYDQADLSCPVGHAVVGIKSNIGTRKDRQFGLNCATAMGMEITDEGLSEDMLSMLKLDVEIPLPDAHTTEGWDQDFHDKCPPNHVLTGFMSVRRAADYSDMKWKIKCGLIKPTARQVDAVSVTPAWNMYHHNFYYSSPERAVLQGMLGDFSTSKNDHHFKFAEYWLAESSKTVGPTWSADWAISGQAEEEFTCGGQALTGIKSLYEGGLRKFSFECRSIGNHQLVHANGSTATASSTGIESDWTDNWVGQGSSFGIGCDGKKVLAGVKTKFDAAAGGYAWKGMCLTMQHN